MTNYAIKSKGTEVNIETRIYKGVEFFEQFSIRFDNKNQKWIAREGGKIITRAKDKNLLISSLYSILKNRECSNFIDLAK